MAAAALTPEKQKQILYGILGIVGLVVWLNFLFLPQWNRWAQQGAELRSLEQQVEETRQLLAQLPVVEQNRQMLQGQVAIPPTAVPPREQLPEILEHIAQAARASRMRPSSLKPKVELKDLAPGPSGYIEVPIGMEVSAAYHQLGAFLDSLESSEHLVRVQEMEIAADDQDVWNHRIVLTLQAYLAPASGGGS